MVCEITKDGDRSPLLPDRLEQGDFFVCDIFDASLKGDMASMQCDRLTKTASYTVRIGNVFGITLLNI